MFQAIECCITLVTPDESVPYICQYMKRASYLSKTFDKATIEVAKPYETSDLFYILWGWEL